MPEVICNTSPLQYLHQLRLLHLLPALAGTVIIPSAVAEELVAGQKLGIDVPEVDQLEWLTIRQPMSAAVLPLVTDLGPGESHVLALAMEMPGADNLRRGDMDLDRLFDHFVRPPRRAAHPGSGFGVWPAGGRGNFSRGGASKFSLPQN